VFKRLRIGLALGGGAARGLAHIGALKALEEADIPIHYISGCSIGSIVGGLYALRPNARIVETQIRDYLAHEVFNKTKMDFLQNSNLQDGGGFFYRFRNYIKKGVVYSLALIKISFISPEIVEENNHYLFGDKEFKHTIIPFCAVASDINNACEIVLTQGSLGKSISASCAIAGIMPIQKIEGKYLVDGGYLDLVPIEPVQNMGATFVIAIDVSKESAVEEGVYNNSLDIVLRSGEISHNALFHIQLKKADMVIHPAVSSIHWADFSKFEETVKIGYESVKNEIPRIKKALFFRRFLPIN